MDGVCCNSIAGFFFFNFWVMCQKLLGDIIKNYFESSVIWQFVIRSLQFWWKERIENKTLLPSHLSSHLQLHFCILEAFIPQGSASS